MDSTLIGFVLLPLMIFFARILDVSLGTLRIMMISKGQKRIAPFLGFFEVLIWLIAMFYATISAKSFQSCRIMIRTPSIQ